MDILNAQDKDMLRVVEGVLGFYGGCCVLENDDMARRVLAAIAGEQKRRADAEIEAQHRYEQSRKETAAILQSRAAMDALPPELEAVKARVRAREFFAGEIKL